MPTTYNGIGTHYYGHKNQAVRTGICRSCQRSGHLVSYDTRLWFVVVFIPLIPLGRKRVIDECPSCRRHMVASADAYEEAKQLQTSASLEQFRREASPAAALGVHAHLLGFHEHDQATSFRATALERFPDHAGLRAGLASQLTEVSAYAEAAQLFEAAYQIDPDLPEARVGVARQRMGQGKLDEARELLDFLEQPGAGQLHSLTPIDQLSTYYQQQGRHEEALKISEHLLVEIPEAGLQHQFRAFVRKSEKALGRTDSILPARRHSLGGLFRAEGSPYSPGQRKGFLVGLALVLLTAGLLVSNEYIRRNRTIFVVNACGAPVQVRVDGGAPQSINGLGRVSISEGHHRLEWSGASTGSKEVDLRSDYFARWTHKPLWILNPGSEAILLESVITYAVNPVPNSQTPHLGQPFVEVDHVDYPFEEPPAQMKVKGRNAQVTKIAFEWVQGQDAQGFLVALGSNRDAALTFAESRLRRDPGAQDLLKYYLSNVPDDGRRALEFLKTGLDRRPFVVNWHRAYQSLAERGGHEGEVLALYDRYLAEAPGDATLLYLRGRIEPDDARQQDFYRRSITANPRLSWPYLALGVHAANRAQWSESLENLRKAKELGIDEDMIRDHVHIARLALGEAGEMVGEYRARIQGGPHDLLTALFLGDALALSGKPSEILPAITGWLNRVPPQESFQIRNPLRVIATYLAGDFAESEKICQADPALRNKAIHFQALAALGRGAEAAVDKSFEKVWDDFGADLTLALAFEGMPKEADVWRTRATHVMESLSADHRAAAKLLEATEPPPADAFARLTLPASEKALIFAAMASRFPARKAEYLSMAARYNIRRVAPYEVVRRAIEANSTGSP